MSEDLIAAGEAMGLTGRDAQEAAIAAFGGVRVVVRAHRRPAVAVLAELGMAAMRLAAVYLLAVPAAGLFAVILQKTLIRVAAPPGTEVVTAPVDYAHTFGVLAVSAITGLALLAGYRLAARRRTRGVRWPGGLVSGTLLGGYFPLAAVTCMLILVLFVIPLPRTITFPGEAFAAARLGAFAMAFGYAVQMAWILLLNVIPEKGFLMRDDRDLIEAYLGELRAKLWTPDAELVLAEAEDHLRESVCAGLAVGMSEREAQEAAISAFGSVRAVVRAHTFRRERVAADLVLAGLKLGWTGMFAIAASGFVALTMNHLFGRSFVGGAPAGTSFAPAQCQYWLSIWHGAHSCAQAAMLESSSDAVSLRVLGGSVGGMALLGAYLLVLLYWRRGRPQILPRGLYPLAAAAVFTVGALALVVCTFTGGPLGVPTGSGAYLSGAMVASAVAAGYAARARRLLRPARS